MKFLGYEFIKRGNDLFIRRGATPKRSSRLIPRPKSFGKSLYSGASTGDLTGDWSTTPISANEALRRNQRTLRARSHDLVNNSDHGHRFVHNLVKGNVVGPDGIGLQSAAAFFETGEKDKTAAKTVESGWQDWGLAENCSMSGTLDWVAQCGLFITTVAEDGETIFQVVRGKTAGKHGFALHQLDVERLDVELNEDLRGGNTIKLGIEFDFWRRPVAYYFTSDGGSRATYSGTTGRHYVRIPASDIIHSFLPERVAQARGVPWMAPTMLRQKMLSAFEEAALVNARVGASKVGAITSEDGSGYGDDLDTVTGEMIVEADPGTFFNLKTGQTVSGWDPDYPNGEFEVFTKSILRSISAGLGVDYAGLTGDLSDVNYSSSRLGQADARETWKGLQRWMVGAFCRPVFEGWLSMALAQQLLKIGKTPLRLEVEEKYRKVTWHPRRWAPVDELKSANANKTNIANCTHTRSQIIREATGRDPQEVWVEMEQETNTLRKMGLLPDAPKKAATEG